MTDLEIIARFMGTAPAPVVVWDVEQKLNYIQRRKYVDKLLCAPVEEVRGNFDYADAWDLIHVPVSRKIAALAFVLKDELVPDAQA